MSESESEEYVEEEVEEASPETIEEESEEESDFTLDQINMMIQATELWDQLIKGYRGAEDAIQHLTRSRRKTISKEKPRETKEAERIEKERKRAKRRRSKK
ncbi:MAG: RNA polymerase subunit Rpo13 [Sulfolobales archaeon]